MRLLNILKLSKAKWFKDNIFIFLLVIICFLILGYPLFVFGPIKTFYISIDPDIVYSTNALLYSKYHLISYIDHPGTPSILLFYYAFFPLRLFAKYILQTNFIQWSFDNFVFLIFYLRIFQLLLFSVSMFLFFNLVKKTTKSLVFIILAFSLVFLFTGIGTYIYIWPETLSLFLTILWLIVLDKYTNSNTPYLQTVLVAISGIALANKFTNLALGIVSVILPLFLYKIKITKRAAMFVFNTLILGASFIFGIWPIKGALYSILKWANTLFTHTEKYGYGVAKVFSLETYLNSVNALMHTHPYTFIFLLITFLLFIYLLFRKEIKIHDPVAILFLISLFCTIVFIKYPTIHYVYVNIILVIFCFIDFLSKMNLKWVRVFTIVLSILFTFYLNNYSGFSLISLQNKPSVEYLLGQWTPLWSADVFRDQLDKINAP